MSLAGLVVRSTEKPTSDMPSSGQLHGGDSESHGQTLDEAPGQASAIIGGKERVIGGWAAYEIDRRECAGQQSADYYASRKFVSPLDVADSLLSSVPGSRADGESKVFMAEALGRLADAMAAREKQISSPEWWASDEAKQGITLPGFGSQYVRQLGKIVQARGHADPEQLRAALSASRLLSPTAAAHPVASTDAAETSRAELIQVPSVSTRDQEAVRALEARCRPYVMQLEAANAEAAAYIETLTNRQ